MLHALLWSSQVAAAAGGGSCASPLPKMGLGGVNLAQTYVDTTLNVTRCCSACDALDACVGWTMNELQATCFLKSTASAPSHNAHAVSSGLKPAPPPPPPAPAGARNVLFVPVDDMRPSLGVYGQPVLTPRFDELGASGTVFSRAFANFAWCSPSRNSFMSGRRPDRTRAWDFGTHFRLGRGAGWTALPEYFRTHGYFVTGAGKLYHKNNPPNFDGARSWSNVTQYPIPYGNKKFGGQSGTAQAGDAFDRCDEQIVDTALQRMVIAADLYHNHSTPFFLGVGLREPHLPYNYPTAYDHLYPPASTFPLAAHRNLSASQPVLGWVDGQHRGAISHYTDVKARGGVNLTHLMPDDLAQHIRRAYYATISYTDAQMGRLLDGLEALNLTASTIVVMFGDHGQQLGEHNLWQKMSNFEVGVRVPFILRAPWKTAAVGQVSDALVELVDLYRTLAELAGLPAPPAAAGSDDHDAVQGKSLAPLLDGFVRDEADAAATSDPAFSYAFSQMTRCFTGRTAAGAAKYYPCLSNAAPLPDLSRAFDFMGYSVRSPGWRLTEWLPWNASSTCPEWSHATATLRELYDHRNDTALYDVDSFENENVVDDPALAGIVSTLLAVIRSSFGEGCD